MTTVFQWRSCKAAEADDDDQDHAHRFRGFAWPQLSIGCNVRAPPPTTYTTQPSILATLPGLPLIGPGGECHCGPMRKAQAGVHELLTLSAHQPRQLMQIEAVE
jgi:hypothetical protein